MPLSQQDYYTYKDYAQWDENVRYELIEGYPYMMSPAPTRIHQLISSKLHLEIASHLKTKSCQIYAAPFDVRLNGLGDEDDTVVQPDLTIVCDRSKLDDKGCNGAPDMVIEILSPSTAKHDRFTKFRLYQEAGVKEYWIVDPETTTIQVHILENSKYYTASYGDTDKISVHVLENCEINLKDVFEE